MPHVPEPRKPPPVEVVEVGAKSVQFLRPLEWVATALKSFRERPLPGSYVTEARPTFDLFGTSRLPEITVEVIAGGVGNLEVLSPRVALDKYRQYLSVDVRHDDAVTPHEIRFVRTLQDPLLGFPNIPFAISASIADGVHFADRNVTVPPDGRIGAEVDAIDAGAQLFLRACFVEFDIGEPYGAIS